MFLGREEFLNKTNKTPTANDVNNYSDEAEEGEMDAIRDSRK